jgi:hypothetical protein
MRKKVEVKVKVEDNDKSKKLVWFRVKELS